MTAILVTKFFSHKMGIQFRLCYQEVELSLLPPCFHQLHIELALFLCFFFRLATLDL